MPSATLVEPAHFTHPPYERTLGPEVADLAAAVGFAPDPEQRLVLDAMFASDPRRPARSASFEVCVVAPRQNIKTGLLKIAALGWLFLMRERLIVWSSHEFPTTQEAFRDLRELIEGSDFLRKRVKQIYTGNGSEAVELLTGHRMVFRARTKTGGRGLSGDKMILDEAFALTPTHMGALMPTLSARPDPQIVYGSSAGVASSDFLRGLRDRGRGPVPGRGAVVDSRLTYVEWCAVDPACVDPACTHRFGEVEGCALDRRELWAMANSQAGRRITWDYLDGERKSLPPEELFRERLGVWDEPGAVDPAFGPGKWESRRTTDEPARPEAFGLAVSIDRAWTSIGASGIGSDGKRQHVGPIRRDRGTQWVIEECVRLQAEHDADIALDGRGPSSDLIPALTDAGVRLQVMSTNDVIDACAGIYDAVQNDELSHGAYDELDAAVAGATARSIGDRWAWGRRTSTTDVSMLEAVTYARWAAVNGASGFNIW